MVEDVAPIRRFVDDETDDGEVGFVASRATGRLRLIAGMVRANRPGRALLGLSKLLVGAFGTAAFSLATNSIWQMGDALDGLRLTVIMLLSSPPWSAGSCSPTTSGRSRHRTPARARRLFNLGTVITLSLAAAVSYAVLFVGTVGAAALLIDASVLEQNLGHPVGLRDYLTLAWIITSMATVGGAIGPASRTRRTCVLRPTATTRRRAGGATSRTRNRTAADRPAPEARYGLRTSFSWWSASRSRWCLRLPGQGEPLMSCRSSARGDVVGREGIGEVGDGCR